MSTSPDRRSFLESSAALGLGGLGFLHELPAVAASEAQAPPELAPLHPEIEPLVRLLEDTPRDKLLEEVAVRVKAGTPYRDVLAALQLAGVRNVQPRPVGFKFHAVLVVNSAHQASLAGPDKERWLPIFWAIDNFKNSQAQNLKEGGWRMKPANEMKLPAAHKAFEVFNDAMSNWDTEAADVAVAALARTAPKNLLFDAFAKFGCRDFRDIGHKAIFVANSFRTLEVIGWHHAEPVLRSLAYALLEHEGENPAKRDGAPDRAGRQNLQRLGKFPADWQGGRSSPEESADLLTSVRTGTADDLSEKVVAILNAGVSPSSVWDGLFIAAGELLMRQPGIVGLHTLTTLNALHYAFQTTSIETTRKLLLLQAAAFLPLFREAMAGRGKIGDARIDALGAEVQNDPVPVKLEDIFATLAKDKLRAAQLAADYLKLHPDGARRLADAGRLLVFLKGTDSHDYKFSSAVLEDYSHIHPAWRSRFLAASLCWMKGSAGPDAPLVGRIRAALM